MKKILTFTATWCGPCKMLKPILQKLADEEKILWDNYDIDIDRDYAKQMGIKSVPTLFFHDAKGTIVSKEMGFMPEAKILELAEQAYNTPVQQTLEEFFDLEPEVEVEVVDSLGEDLEVDIVAEIDKILAEKLTPPTEDPLLAIEPEIEGETFVDLEEVLPEPEEEVIFTPPHTIFDEQPEDELVVEDEAAEDINPLV